MLFELDLTGIKEPEILQRGVYAVQISNAEYDGSEGKNNIVVSIVFPDHPDAAVMRHWVALPKVDDPVEKKRVKLLMTRRFMELFNVPFSAAGFSVQDFFGRTASCMVSVEETQDGQGNSTGRVVNRLNPPPIKSELPAGVIVSTSGRKKR